MKKNKIQRNAKAFENLLNTEYYICLSHKGKGFEVCLKFCKEDFHHLEGIGQLKDLDIHKESGNITFLLSKDGDIAEELLQKSKYYVGEKIQNKVDNLYLLEEAIDNNKIMFRMKKGSNPRIRIDADIFLFTKVGNEEIFLYIDKIRSSNMDYYCRSFVANPDFDRTEGQLKLTLLCKEKRNLLTGDSVVQYQFKDFTPDKLKHG